MKLTKENSRKRWNELRELIIELDPIGLIGLGSPRDEYDCLIGPTMRLLEDRKGPMRIAWAINKDFVEHFGLKSQPLEAYRFAKRVHAWYQQNWRGSRIDEESNG